MDLFELQVEESKLHPNFKNLVKDGDLREVINRWCIGFEDRDNKFAKEFQTTFNTSFWEIYLHACFTNLGFKLDYSFNTPDFLIQTRKSKANIVVEAVTTNNANGDRAEYERLEALNELYENRQLSSEKLHGEITKVAAERISNSINSKSTKYMRKYSKLNHVMNKPFIIAVGAYEQPLFYRQGIGPILKVLYGLEKASLTDSSVEYEKTKSIKKISNNVDIPVGIFNDDSHKHISGVIFSPVATMGKVRALTLKKKKEIFFNTYQYNINGVTGNLSDKIPHKKYKESLFDGLMLCLNPFAENPIDPNDFDNPYMAVIFGIDDDRNKMEHGFLFGREVINLKFID